MYVKKMAGVIICKAYVENKIHVYDQVYSIKNNVFTISGFTNRLITTHWIFSQAHKWAENRSPLLAVGQDRDR
jgi:hypothetical protein